MGQLRKPGKSKLATRMSLLSCSGVACSGCSQATRIKRRRLAMMITGPARDYTEGELHAAHINVLIIHMEQTSSVSKKKNNNK